MSFNQYEVGKRIQGLRSIKDKTQEQVADDFNVSDRHMRAVEGGEKAPSIELLIEMTTYFGTTLDFLILGKKTTPREQALEKQLEEKQRCLRQLHKKLQNFLKILGETM